jgi:hypothetical protein
MAGMAGMTGWQLTVGMTLVDSWHGWQLHGWHGETGRIKPHLTDALAKEKCFKA